MKILNGVVGYLAVTALAFHPFAFVSPLAATSTDYDGYVDITQNHIDGALMKQALGTIVETCQTVTTQNHTDSALMKRVPGDIIEARQAAVVIPVVGAILAAVSAVILSVLWIEKDDSVRGNDVEFLVA